MASPMMEPLVGSKDHPPAFAAAPDVHGGATTDESSTVVDKGTDADESRSTGVASARAGEKSNDEDVEEDEISAVEKEEEVCDDAEAVEMAARMEQRLGALPGKAHESEPFTIFRVAGPMRERNRHLYEPQMVSIGPFHRGAGRHLAAMEEHKWRCLRDLLARNPDAPLATYVRAARDLEPEARRRYAEPVPLTADEFAEMLLLDGCFVVEFFLKGEDRADDALIDAAWAMQNVYNDLFLLENQLPFFVIERFYDIATGGLGRDYFVTNLLVKYLTVDFGTAKDGDSARSPDGEIHHLLHLYYHWFLPPEDRAKSGTSSKDEEDAAFDELMAKPVDERVPWQLRSASELQYAGVTFRAKKSARSLVDVTFHSRDGVLEIPAVDRYTNQALFANLLAYEQSRGRWELQRLVSYVLLMASVVDAQRDVEILQQAGVFTKGDEETAAFYSHLGELCPPPEFVNNCYNDLFRDVREYCGRSWNRHRAVLVHDYFSNPWTSMSAAAAVVLLVLTVVQTVYTVLPYYNPSPG
ncbi:UPF0481 protein At3g47200-like isoform X2 [Phragmites australis]|uniref:UPF0481 protein At3g47200-like isoform X2 n=1 Tax=Phragmites australis TaxID=29695 RepID=UPI002D7A3B70|nr:UPF0481 protein At3g47200-like isoform X2 [Phragmites australis]